MSSLTSTQKSSSLLPCGRPRLSAPRGLNEAKIEELKAKLRAYLSEKNLKFTEQRWSVAQTILKTGGHLEAQQIVEIARQEDPEIGPATVYRAIKTLCEAGILEQSHRSFQNRILYEFPNDEHHDHITCVDCGEIFEFHDEEIEARQNAVASKMHFKVSEHRHVIQARCDFFKSK